MARGNGALPSWQKGVVSEANGSVRSAQGLAIPQCPPTALLVRVCSVGLSPSDYKMPGLVQMDGLVVGNDFAGEIVEVGAEANAVARPDCAPWAVGDRVCGVVHGTNPLHPTWGAFAEYVEADPYVLMRLPAGCSWAEAAGLGGSAVGAVGLGLFHEMQLTPPWLMDRKNGDDGRENGAKKPTVLVYGGSTACGTMALQLLQL